MNILVLFDESKQAIKALSYVYLFLQENAKLVILYIVDIDHYADVKELAESTGIDSKVVDQAILDLEVKVKKKLSGFLKKCEELNINTKCVFKIGKVTNEILEEILKEKYDLLVIPIGESLKEKITHILDGVIKKYPGTILLVK